MSVYKELHANGCCDAIALKMNKVLVIHGNVQKWLVLENTKHGTINLTMLSKCFDIRSRVDLRFKR